MFRRTCVANVPKAETNGMGEVAVIAGPLLEPACHIDPPVRLEPKLPADTESTAYKRVILPKGNQETSFD